MRAIVFLDIDDVLTVRPRPIYLPRPAVIRRNGTVFRRVAAKVRRPRAFSPAAIETLNALTTATEAQLVLSSSWRSRPGCRATVIAAGVTGDWHQDWRTDDMPGSRGEQIDRWLAAHDGPPYVVLDDWAAELPGHADRLALIDHRYGLRPEDGEKARRVLLNQNTLRPDCSPSPAFETH